MIHKVEKSSFPISKMYSKGEHCSLTSTLLKANGSAICTSAYIKVASVPRPKALAEIIGAKTGATLI